MKEIEGIMDEGLNQYPNNLLHCFGSTTSNFGIEDDDQFKDRKINFMFALKHVNNGKVNSYKWLLQGVAEYLKPKYI